MASTKKLYRNIMDDFDEEKYSERYCKKKGCIECTRTGEPGCVQRERYIAEWYQSILRRRVKKLTGRNK
jgi:hypothetical protein